MDKDIVSNLNKDQRAAVMHITGPVRVIAGAGSGKTRVITSKIAYLIEYGKLKPWRICALTFTNKAANEMKERIVKMIGGAGQECRVSTYHSLCMRILREEINVFGYPKSFNLIDTPDQDGIIKNIYKEFNFKWDMSDFRSAKSAISTWTNDFITPAEAIRDAYPNTAQANWAKVYQKYEARKRELKALDFNDLIVYVFRLFKEHSDVLAKWQNRFDYFLVDEFQDTNELQFDIIKMMCSPKNNITVVGDPDQTIYSWRGAKVRIIVDFDRIFKECATIVLDQNYRSTQHILNLANNLIAKNHNRIDKNLYTENDNGVLPIVHEAPDTEHEAEWVSEQICNLVAKENKQYSDFLILYRANYLSRELESELANHSIPYRIFGAFKFYERKEIKDTLALLKAIFSDDELSIFRLLGGIPKVGPKTVESIALLAQQNGLSVVEMLVEHDDLLSANLQTSLAHLISALKYGKSEMTSVVALSGLMNEMVSRANIIRQLKDNMETERVENINELLNAVNKFDSEHVGLVGLDLIDEYLQLVGLQTYGEDGDESAPTVSLMTIHMAKGLEKPVVFIIGLNEGVFPSNQAIRNDNAAIEEERRTFYVALTRAKELLYISYAHGFSYVTSGERMQSRFIRDLDDKLYTKSHDNKVDNQYGSAVNYTKFDNAYDNFIVRDAMNVKGWNVGQVVRHGMFGQGIIVKVIGPNIQINFSQPYGLKVIKGDSPTISLVKN